MKHFSIIILLFTFITFNSFAQEEEERRGRPNIPGTLQFDFGYSFSISNDSLPFRVGGNRTFNAYYYQDLMIGSSKFSFHPGIGLGLDRLGLDTDTVDHIVAQQDVTQFTRLQNLDIRKSMFIMNYIDVPIEFRFNSNPADLRRSFKVAIGAKVGYSFQAKSKLKFIENNENVVIKENRDFNLSPFRYATYLRVGGSDYYLWVNYALNPLFQPGEGPGGKDIRMMTIGFSFNGF